jgi:uncharacterized membrane-anchored protein YitT (DUF2179 family)
MLKIQKEDLKAYAEITLGCIITAMSLNLFLVPYNIAPGGVSGLAIVIHYFLNFPVGATMLALNIPLFILGIKQLGGRFGIRTLFGTAALSVLVDFTSWMKFDTNDLLLSSIFGGILMGIGLGLVFRAGATTGGTDLAARIIHSFAQYFTVGQLMFFADACVVLLAAFSFRSYELGLYAIVTIFISAKIVDAIVEGFDVTKGAFIISEHSEEISNKILDELSRGVTALKGTGMYTKQDKDVLLVVVERTEVIRLKELVKGIDDKAFVILTDIREVLGEGFKNKE